MNKRWCGIWCLLFVATATVRVSSVRTMSTLNYTIEVLENQLISLKKITQTEEMGPITTQMILLSKNLDILFNKWERTNEGSRKIDLVDSKRYFDDVIIEDRNQRLIEASKDGHLEIVKLLIEKGADVNTSVKIQFGHNDGTPLLWAVSNGHLDFVKLLIEKGADVNARFSNNRSPLSYAAQNGYLEIAKLLIEKGADIDTKGSANSTPLHWAAANGRLEIAELLIKKGADVNAKNHKHATPLIWAVSTDHLEVAKLLIENGADVNAKNNDNQTALESATRHGFEGVVRLLQQHATISDI